MNIDFAAVVVAQSFLLAQRWVVRIVSEAATGGVILVSLHFAGEVASGRELQALGGWQGANLVDTLIRVVPLPLGNVDEGECTETLDWYAATAFGELVADFVKHGRQNLLNGGAADTGAFNNLTDEVLFVIGGTGHWK